MNRSIYWQNQKKCGAKTRSGEPCRGLAMRNGRCRMHGGKTPRGWASPHLKHGCYSKDATIIWLNSREERRFIRAAYVELNMISYRVEDEIERAKEVARQKRFFEELDLELLEDFFARIRQIRAEATHTNFVRMLAELEDES